MSRKRTLYFILINLFLFISTIIVTYFTLAFGTVAGQVDTGTKTGGFYIVTFTVDSNILLGLVAGIAAVLAIINLRKTRFNAPADPVPFSKNLAIWYLVATSSAVLTWLTVIFVLAPIRAISGKNYFDMLLGPMFFFHFLNPLLAALSFIFCTGSAEISKKSLFLALIPPALYAIPYTINVVFLKTWPDFYGVTFGGRPWFTPLALLAFCLFIFGIAATLSICRSRAIINIRRKGVRVV